MQAAGQAPFQHQESPSHTRAPTRACRWKPLPALGREEQFSCRSGEERETPQSNLRHGESEVCFTEPIKNTHGISNCTWNLRLMGVICYGNIEYHYLRAGLWGQKDKKEECRLRH